MNVVIIDDEPVIGKGISKLISQAKSNWNILGIFYNAEEALELSDWDKVDILISDINMPEMSGLDLVDLIYSRGYSIKVIFVSGYSEFEYVQHALRQQAIDYVIKPVSKEKLLCVLEKAEKSCADDRIRFQRDLCIKSNLLSYQSKFLSDYIFETKKFSIDELKSSFLTLHLEDVKYIMMVFYTNVKKASIENILAGENEEKGTCFLFGQNDIFTVLFSKIDKERIDLFIESMETRNKVFYYKIEKELLHIVDLPLFYNKLIDELKNNMDSRISNINYNVDDLTFDVIFNDISIPVQKSIEYIHSNYYKNLSLQVLADEVYVHPTYLSNLFKKETGYSVIDYINQYRVYKAKELLKNGKNKVYWVTEQVGFVNQRYFSQVFKKITGMTPVQYKQTEFMKQK